MLERFHDPFNVFFDRDKSSDIEYYYNLRDSVPQNKKENVLTAHICFSSRLVFFDAISFATIVIGEAILYLRICPFDVRY